MKYKVLMIDDEFEKDSIQDFILNASISSVEIIPVKFHDDGIKLLKEDKNFEFQAIILDATGFENKEDNELSNIGLKNSIEFLKEYRSTRLIPWFVYTGADRNKKVNEFEREIKRFQKDIKFGRPELTYYVKTENEDELIDDIIEEIDKLKYTSIEYRYKKIFRIARDLKISDEELSTLMMLFNFLDKAEDIKPGIYFTQIRKYVEYVFRALVKLNILHESCIDKSNGQINLSESSRLLAGLSPNHLKIKCTKTHLPKILAENLKNLIFITGAASHTSEVDETRNMDYQAYYNQIQSPYLLYQLLFTVSDLFLWYDQYVTDFNDIEANKLLWEVIKSANENEPIDAIFYGPNPNGSGTLKCIDGREVVIHNKIVESNNLANNENLAVVLERKQDKYNYNVKAIIKK